MRLKLVFCLVLTLAIRAGVVWGEEVPIAFIKVAEVNELIEKGTKIVLVDVRSQEEYLDRHIKGAVSIPLHTLPERYQEIPQEGLVVLY